MFGNEPGQPGGIDEAEGKKIAKMRAIFVAERVELHPHQGLEGHDGVVIGRHKAGGLKRRGDCGGVAAADEQIDVLGVADRGAIDAGHPGGDGVATGHRVFEVRAVTAFNVF